MIWMGVVATRTEKQICTTVGKNPRLLGRPLCHSVRTLGLGNTKVTVKEKRKTERREKQEKMK